jgi:hypothetical protein
MLDTMQAPNVAQTSAGRTGKPVVLIVGADKGGVGKTTVTRTLLDYLASKNVTARAFDAEHPRGTLKRFHPIATDVIDITEVADQMKLLDTLHSTDVKISVVDIRAGHLSNTLQAMTDVGFFDMVSAGEFDFGLMHVVGSSVASLDEINEMLPLVEDKQYFVVKNFINDTSFFGWNPEVYKSYFNMLKNAVEVNVPRLNEMAYEQVELAGVPFSTFVANRNSQGLPGNYSMVLRGYVRTWLNQVCAEYDRIGLVDRF